MRIGFIHDRPGYLGGAEMTKAELAAAAPDGIEVIDCAPGAIVAGLDAYVVHNCVQYRDPSELALGAPLIWYHHDLSPWIRAETRQWLDRNARHVFCSPLQLDRYCGEIDRAEAGLIPPPLDRSQLPTADERAGAVSIGQWRGPGKGAAAIVRWAAEHGSLTVYGSGEMIPSGPNIDYGGELSPGGVPYVLARHETFVFLPRDPEPFGRTVAEAWAAGCELVVNRNVGALWWIEHNPAAMETAGRDFWTLVSEEAGRCA